MGVPILLLALGADPSPALEARLSSLQAAFRSEDARAVRASCSGRTRVRVDLGELTGGSASYGPGQLEAVMRRVFRERRTESFEMSASGATVDGERAAYATADWRHRAEDGEGEARQDSLTFVLHREDADWRVVELRASR
jgi:ketosteroid isomerase-like protein